jgi:hypothetical protein
VLIHSLIERIASGATPTLCCEQRKRIRLLILHISTHYRVGKLEGKVNKLWSLPSRKCAKKNVTDTGSNGKYANENSNNKQQQEIHGREDNRPKHEGSLPPEIIRLINWQASVVFADGKVHSLPVGPAYLNLQDREGPCVVMFSSPGVFIIGATALENLGFAVDPVNQCLIPNVIQGRPF